MKEAVNTAFDLEEERKELARIASETSPDAPFDIKMRDYMMRTIKPFARTGSCLQLGCAHGDQTFVLARNFEKVVVIEAVRELIDYTQERAKEEGVNNIEFIHTMVEEFDSDQRFDNIILSHVLEHIHDDEGVLRILLRHLDDEGRMFVLVPNANAASRLIAVKMGALDMTESFSAGDLQAGHRRIYHMDHLCAVMRAAGGNIIHTAGIFFKPLANFQFDALMGGDLISDAFMEGCYELGKEYPLLSASIMVVAEKPQS